MKWSGGADVAQAKLLTDVSRSLTETDMLKLVACAALAVAPSGRFARSSPSVERRETPALHSTATECLQKLPEHFSLT